MSRDVPSRLRGLPFAAAFLACVVAASGLVTMARPTPAFAAPQTFPYTGAPQLYVVPAGVTSIHVVVSGAAGASPAGGGAGGSGGVVEADIAVQPGESLMVMVGGSGAAGGFNGGGRGAGTGGGASDIRQATTPISDPGSCAFDLTCGTGQRIIVAGGGGGGASLSLSGQVADGGAGGAVPAAGAAVNASINGQMGNASGGGAGTGSAGGSAGGGTRSQPSITGGASAGSVGSGGIGAWVAGATGGGGGGGYWGGGGGGVSDDAQPSYTPNGAGGGGGGYSWAGGSSVSNAVFNDGARPGNGVITIDPPSAITGAAFGFTGAPQFYTVPMDVSSTYVRLYGGAGGASGDVVSGELPVTPGETLQLNLGGRGWGAAPEPGFVAYAGGWNGGGSGTQGGFAGAGSGGGGASDVRRCSVTPCALGDRLVVAGGGGGSSEGSWGLGGGVGGAGNAGEGGNGSAGNFGQGASLSSGGASGGGSATAGTLGQGGAGSGSWAGSGGGGGGLYGGGGGNDSGGGGGSSYASVTGPGGVNVLQPSGIPFSHQRGGSAGNGLAIITAMPIGVTDTVTLTSPSAVSIVGQVNPKFLATRPVVVWGTSLAAVTDGTATSTSLGAGTLAGGNLQGVSGPVSGLSSAGTTYYFRVCAQSAAGKGCGVIRSVTTPQAGYPYFTADTPTTSGVAGTSYPSYTFAAASSPSASITFGVGSGALPPGLTLDSSGLLSGTPTAAGTYTFAVTATNGSGSTTTSTITVTIGANPSPPTPALPSAPTNVTAMPGAGQATITWGVPANPGASPISSYQVTASPGGQACTTTSTSCTISGLTNGTTYTFSAVAVSSAGFGASAISNPVTPSLDPAPVPAPGPQPLPTPLPPGGSSLTVNGVPQPLTVEPNAGSNGLAIIGDEFDMNLDGLGPDGQRMNLGADGVLELDQERQAQSSGRGFLGHSDIDFYLDPPLATARRSVRAAGTFMGTLVTRGDGTFTGTVTLPDTIESGEHVLQAVGLTAQGEPRAVSIGVRVKAWIQLDRGTRTSAGRHDRVSTTGSTAGIPKGTRLTPWIKFSGQDRFRQGRAVVRVKGEGTFRWTRLIRKDRALTAYVSYVDVTSNRETWVRVR